MKNNEDFLQLIAVAYECYFASNFSKFVTSAAAKRNIKVEDFFEFFNSKSDKSAQQKCILGTLYFEGIGCKRDFDQARGLFQESLESKYAPASYNLASIYAGGCGIERDHDIVFTYTEAAANSGLWVAVYKLYLYYKHGLGVKEDPKKADELLQKSKELTFPQLLTYLKSNYMDFAIDLRITYESFYLEAFDNFRVTANEFFEYLNKLEKFSPVALCIFADLHKNGIGTKQDNNLAKYWYGLAARKECPRALYSLAFLSAGYGACLLIAAAAKANFRPAIYELARHYKYGWDLSPNYLRSLELFLEARDMGDYRAEEAIYSLISYVLNEVSLSTFNCYEKLNFLLKARTQGFDVADGLLLLLKQIDEDHKPEFVYRCYTLISPLDIAYLDAIMVNANIVFEIEMDRLRIQVAKLLGNRKEAFQNQIEMIPIVG
jgi:TPR repeat protein